MIRISGAVLAFLALSGLAAPLAAQSSAPFPLSGEPLLAMELFNQRHTLGWGRLFTNDYLGDGHDRWRSGSYTVSLVRGREDYFGGPLPAFGDILEYRLHSELIMPVSSAPSPGDRLYVGALSLGMHTHFQAGPGETSLGFDLLATGPQTGVSSFQDWAHQVFGQTPPPYTDVQLGNQVHLGATAEYAVPFQLGQNLTFRPFVELKYGIEDIARVGGDFIFGKAARDSLILRDEVTGQLVRGSTTIEQGFQFTAGGDFAAVGNSVYMPASGPATPTATRTRLRAGLRWVFGTDMDVFYGLTYLSPEFLGQPTGQTLGSLKINWRF